MALRFPVLLRPPRFEPPPLLRHREERYRRLLVPFAVVACVSTAVLWAIEPLPEVLFGLLAFGGLGAFAIAAVAVSSSRRALGTVLGGGAVFALAGALLHGELPRAVTVAGGAGVGAFAVLGLWLAQANAEERAPLRTVLVPCLLSAIVFTTGFTFLTMTVLFLPRVLDPFVYALDTTLGVHSFDVGRLYARAPSWLIGLSHFVYDYVLFGMFLVYLRELADPRARGDVFLATALASTWVVVVFFAVPVVGPVVVFAKEFPWSPPAVSALVFEPIVGAPAPRNCVPSMHNGWALLLVWHARPYGRVLRALAWGALALTFVTTLGFGYHYVFDVVVTVPFVLAIDAATTPVAASSFRARRVAIVSGAAMTLGWIVAIRFGTPLLLRARPLAPLLAIALTAASLLLHRALDSRAVPFSQAAREARTTRERGASRRALFGAALGFIAATSALPIARVAALALGSPTGVAIAMLGLSVAAMAWGSAGAIALGASVGAIVTGFVVLPSLGARDTIALAAFAGLALGLAAYVRSRRGDASDDRSARETTTTTTTTRSRAGALVVTAAGALTVGVAMIYAHLIAAVIGDGADVTTLTIASSLFGIAAGVWLRRRRDSRFVFAALYAGALAVVLLATNAIWSHVPDYFASFAGYGVGREFADREVVRFGMCFVLCVPAAASLGALYTVAASLAGQGRRTSVIGALGGVVGGVVFGVLLLPNVGSRWVIDALAALAVLVAGGAWLACRPAREANADARLRLHDHERRALFVVAALVLAGLVVQPARFDFDRLTSAASMDFAHARAGHVVALEESFAGGITTVERGAAKNGEETRAVFVDGVRLSGKSATSAASTRSLLRSSRERFARIALEPPNLWSRGAPSLYTREAYEDVRAHLADAGVLEERVPLARVRLADVLAIVATVHAVFPRVWLVERDGEGSLIACATCAALPDPSDAPLLVPAEVDALVRDLGASAGGDVDALLLTDDRDALAMSGVVGNDLDAARSRAVVTEWLSRYRSRR